MKILANSQVSTEFHFLSPNTFVYNEVYPSIDFSQLPPPLPMEKKRGKLTTVNPIFIALLLSLVTLLPS